MEETQAFERMESYSDSEEVTFYEPVQNPLWLDLILDRVFSYLPKSALANCRLVSRQWLEVSEPYFVTKNRQNPTTVDLRFTDHLLSFLSTFVQRRDFDLDSMGRQKPSLWSSYKFRVDKISPLQQQLPFEKIIPFQQQFFMKICGDSMKRVAVDRFDDLEIISALTMFLNWTPQLETLELTCKVSINVLNPENQQQKNIFECLETLKNSERPFFTHLRCFCLLSLHLIDIAQEDIEPVFSSLFQLMPHLEDFRLLHVFLDSRFQADLITASVFQALQVQVKFPEKGQVTENPPSFLSQLVSLQLPNLSNQHLYDLHQFSLDNSLRLEKFWLVSFWDSLDLQNLLTFLQGQEETLQKLCLAPYAAILFLHFPLSFTLDHVTTLKIFRWTETLDECYLFVPHILVHFPNLKKLTIFQHDNKVIHCTNVMSTDLMKKLAVEQSKLRIASMSSNLVILDQLTTIKFSGSGSFQQDDEFLTWLTKICPNVTDLELRFSCREGTLAVRPVFEVWHKLRRLVIYFSGWKEPRVMNSYFTGILHQKNQPSHPRFCISVLKNFQGRDWHIVHKHETSRDRETGEKFPSLLFLQDLETLEIDMAGNFDTPDGTERWFLSDQVVLTTLMRMPKLREFCIKESSISPSVLRTLNDALNLEKCRVGDKEGRIIQFKEEGMDLACDNGKGQVDNIGGASGGQELANAKPCQSLQQASTLQQYGAFNLLVGPESCCPIV